MDTPADPDDPVLQQLKKLREGAGLTPQRLKRSGAVLSALATSDPVEGYAAIRRLLDDLGATEQAAALEVDFGVRLEQHLDAHPTPRELSFLTGRRSSYSQVIGRDVKTLARWSDKALGELRNRLLTDIFNGHLYVVAAVRGNRIVATSLIRETVGGGQDGARERTSLEHDNPETGPSLPCLIYAFPRDWRPGSLSLAVSFLEKPYPAEGWAIVAEDFINLSFGRERFALAPNEETLAYKVENPRRDRVYGLWWGDESGTVDGQAHGPPIDSHLGRPRPC
jgi:hypothetical protein